MAIPTHNRAGLLPGAVQSVLNQTHTDFELLILDDGSTDNTGSLVSEMKDKRIVYVRHSQNIGMTANWNKCVELARGTYVAILHDDDRWLPTFLARAREVFKSCPEAGFVFSAPADEMGLERNDAVWQSRHALDRLRRRCEVAEEAVLIRRAAFLDVGGFSDEWPYSMDWQMWFKMAARFPVGYIAEPLGYEENPTGDTFSDRLDRNPLAIAKDRYGMLQATIPHLPLSHAERKTLLGKAMRSLAESQLVAAWDHARRGDRARARAEAAFARTIDPRWFAHAPLLSTAAFLSLVLPTPLLRGLNTLRAFARPVLRRQ